jgi:hypothetical protein
MTEVMKSIINQSHYSYKQQPDMGNKNTRNILNSKARGTVGANFGMTLNSFGGGSII